MSISSLLVGLQIGRGSSLLPSGQVQAFPWAFFWGPGQSGLSSLEHVFLLGEGGCSQKGKQKHEKALQASAQKASLLFLSPFHWPEQVPWPGPTLGEERLLSHGGEKGRKGMYAGKVQILLCCHFRHSFYKSEFWGSKLNVLAETVLLHETFLILKPASCAIGVEQY